MPVGIYATAKNLPADRHIGLHLGLETMLSEQGFELQSSFQLTNVEGPRSKDRQYVEGHCTNFVSDKLILSHTQLPQHQYELNIFHIIGKEPKEIEKVFDMLIGFYTPDKGYKTLICSNVSANDSH